MSIKEREEFLFQKLREKDPDIVADGVICEQEFLNARCHDLQQYAVGSV